MIIVKLLIIPADNRQLFMTERLKKNGIECVSFHPNLPMRDTENKFDGVVFALPSIKFSRINCEYDVKLESILPLVKKGGYVFCAMADEIFKSTVEKADLKLFDYYSREELIISNAALTAQGVLEIVLVNTDVIIKDLKVLVTGYGKTGEAIADVLSRNYADVTVAARKASAAAKARMKNLKAVDFCEMCDVAKEFDFVINTVPQKVIGESQLARFSDKCIFLEIASKPYGIDVLSAERQNKKVIIASSLPGKYVACSAGNFIAESIIGIIREESIND